MVATKKSGSHRVKAKPTAAEKRSAGSRNAPAGSAVVTIDRRHGHDRRTGRHPIAVERRGVERRAKVNRRRQIDPTTCERDYTSEEIEFMAAMDEYKRRNGRMFPTCSEVLEVIRSLGYQKCPKSDAPESPIADATTTIAAIDAVNV